MAFAFLLLYLSLSGLRTQTFRDELALVREVKSQFKYGEYVNTSIGETTEKYATNECSADLKLHIQTDVYSIHVCIWCM